MTNIVPNRAQPLHLARGAIRNAADKLRDAELLIENASWGTAYSVAALAMEEIGKAVLCVSAFSSPWGTPKELGNDLLKHKLKLEAAVGLVQVINGDDRASVTVALKRAKELVPEIHDRRMRGQYVDSPDPGILYTPADVTETDTRELIGYLSAAVEVLRPMSSEEAAGRLTELAREHVDSFQGAAALGLELAELAPDTAAKHAREMFRGEIPGQPTDQPRADE